MLPVMVAGTVFLLAAGTFALDHALYLKGMHAWMSNALGEPFYDMRFVIAQLSCWRSGVDVYATVPCDPSGRLMDYPPIWLRLWFLPDDPSATVPLGIGLAFVFILSLATLPRSQSAGERFLLLAAILSPVTAYAVERGNTDLLTFILASAVVFFAERGGLFRPLMATLVFVAGALKLYPFSMIILLARERIPTAIGMLACVLLGGAVMTALWWDEFPRMLRNIPEGTMSFHVFGAARISELLASGAGNAERGSIPNPFAVTAFSPAQIVLVACLLFASLTAALISRTESHEAACARLSARESSCLLVGAVLFCSCFVLHASATYRAVMLIFVIPGLFRTGREPGNGVFVRWSAALTVLWMWSSNSVLSAGGSIQAGALSPMSVAVVLTVWLMRELLSWWIFIVLLAALFNFLRVSSRGWRAVAAPSRIRA